MDIDSSTLKVTLRDGVPGTRRPDGEYFTPFYRQTWADVGHFNEDQRICVYYINDSGILRGRSKIQELARGDFGTVYAWMGYGYESAAGSSLDVRAYANSVGHEKPEIIANAPSDSSHPDAISVIRIFRAGPGFLIASGLYSWDGVLQNVVLDAAKAGDWIHQNRIPEVDDTLQANAMHGNDYVRFRDIFGFPAHLQISDLLLDLDQWHSGTRTAATTFVNLHCDRNRWVRQTSFRASGPGEVRFLRYHVSAQDRLLEQIESRGSFRTAVVRP